MLIGIDDRRVFDRFMARFPVKFKDARDGFGSNVFLRDVSAQGVKIQTRKPLFINDKVELLVEIPDGHDPMTLSGNVVWARGINPTMRQAGLKFDRVDFMDTQRIFKYCQ